MRFATDRLRGIFLTQLQDFQRNQHTKLSKLSALNEIGHGLSELREQGWRPRRTIVLASWGAEVKCSFLRSDSGTFGMVYDLLVSFWVKVWS